MKKLLLIIMMSTMVCLVACSNSDHSNKTNNNTAVTTGREITESETTKNSKYKKLKDIEDDSNSTPKGAFKAFIETYINDDYDGWYSITTVDGVLPEQIEVREDGKLTGKSEFYVDLEFVKDYADTILIADEIKRLNSDINDLTVYDSSSDSDIYLSDIEGIEVKETVYIPFKILDIYGEVFVYMAEMINVDDEWYLLKYVAKKDYDKEYLDLSSEAYMEERKDCEETAKLFANAINNRDFNMYYELISKELFNYEDGFEEILEEYMLTIGRVVEYELVMDGVADKFNIPAELTGEGTKLEGMRDFIEQNGIDYETVEELATIEYENGASIYLIKINNCWSVVSFDEGD
ncbi:MAG: hypothetical protein IJC76_10515 [Lachnospiraceae bacterium]|nr:hypothetical protein [Lachnospiraceae bacterium]